MEHCLCRFRVPVLISWPVKGSISTRCSVMVSKPQSDSEILFCLTVCSALISLLQNQDWLKEQGVCAKKIQVKNIHNDTSF